MGKVKSSEKVVESKVNTKTPSNVLYLVFVHMNILVKTSRKTNLRNKVISSQYILKDMKCFEFETEILEPKRLMTFVIQLS